MSNITNIFSSLNNFISLYSTADATISGAEAINSSQQLTNACENYEANPSTETAEAVRNAARDALLDKVELISGLLPGDPFIEPSEQLTGSYASLIASRVDNSEMDEILEYQYKKEARNNDRARRGDIDTTCRDRFSDARTAAPIRRDPLILDLDSDGFETVGIDTTAPILFDHDGDGVKTATGWVAGDDAFLVLDRNGNGTIDDGHELFGDATPLAAGGTAADGFAALAQEDSNNDGQVDALDAHFADLRLWRDLNQDGISQSDELLTLASQGIVSLSTARITNSTLLANGNQIADLGTHSHRLPAHFILGVARKSPVVNFPIN